MQQSPSVHQQPLFCQRIVIQAVMITEAGNM
jgi:hypothetical protein